jgi:hypothetical protein
VKCLARALERSDEIARTPAIPHLMLEKSAGEIRE